MAPTSTSPEQIFFKGETLASYFWDDGSSINGDTGMPAGGKPMQEGLFASPSWPMGTEGYVTYKGKSLPFFIGDRGPGTPSENGIMLDMDGITYAKLTGGVWNAQSRTVENFGPGRIDVSYVITKWGTGTGKKGEPLPFSSGAWNVKDNSNPQPLATATQSPEAGHRAAAPAAPKASAAPASPKTESAAPSSPPSAKPSPSESATPQNSPTPGGPLSAPPATSMTGDVTTTLTNVASAPHGGLEPQQIAAPAGVLSAVMGAAAVVAFIKIRRRPASVSTGRHRKEGRHRPTSL